MSRMHCLRRSSHGQNRTRPGTPWSTCSPSATARQRRAPCARRSARRPCRRAPGARAHDSRTSVERAEDRRRRRRQHRPGAERRRPVVDVEAHARRGRRRHGRRRCSRPSEPTAPPCSSSSTSGVGLQEKQLKKCPRPTSREIEDTMFARHGHQGRPGRGRLRCRRRDGSTCSTQLQLKGTAAGRRRPTTTVEQLAWRRRGPPCATAARPA